MRFRRQTVFVWLFTSTLCFLINSSPARNVTQTQLSALQIRPFLLYKDFVGHWNITLCIELQWLHMA
jgi:hypothetical protein